MDSCSLDAILLPSMFAIKNRMIEISENFPGKNIEDICHFEDYFVII